MGLTIVGTTIGAGFASGREIWEFFSSYGMQSKYGIIIAMALFGLSSIIIVWISYKYQTENYYEVLVILMGKPLAKAFDGLIFLYLFSGTMIMFAGSGATFKQWNLPYFAGILFLAVFIWIVLLRDIEGLMDLNSLVVPILIFTLIYVSYRYTMSHHELSSFYIRSHLKVWPSAITYSAFNILSLFGVLSTMGKKVESLTEIFYGGSIAAFFLGLVAALMNSALLKLESAQQYEIPLFAIVSLEKPFYLYLTTIILWLAVYTTALSNVHGLVHRIQRNWFYPTAKISFLVIITIIPLAFIGFSTLVNILYPIYGVLNLYVLAILLLYPFQTMK